MSKKKKKKNKIRNLVAKFARLFNRALVLPDETKYDRKKNKKWIDED
jgi:hypothetical protein